MSHSDAEILQKHNTSRFCVEHPQIAWVLLLFTLAWGWMGYNSMPQRKDPDIPVRRAVVITPWAGNSAEKVERQVTNKVEKAVARNSRVKTVTSVSRPGLSIVYVDLLEDEPDPGRQFDDIYIKLGQIADLPSGAGPVQFEKDFGDTVALMLTIASPPIDREAAQQRAKPIQAAIQQIRSRHPGSQRASIIYCFPTEANLSLLREDVDQASRFEGLKAVMRDVEVVEGQGFLGLDGTTSASDAELLKQVEKFEQRYCKVAEMHPDSWHPVVVRDPASTADTLLALGEDKYSYRDLDIFSERIETELKAVPEATKVDRTGVLPEKIFLYYSQERLAAYQGQPYQIADILKARNIPGASGFQESSDGKQVRVNASGAFRSEKEIGAVQMAIAHKAPVYLRDLVKVVRSYESPPTFLNFLCYQDAQGKWRRGRAVTITVQMRPGRKIAEFGAAVERALDQVRQILPSDLVVRKTSDQPRQVDESIKLFSKSLEEAVVLVVLVSLIGFWEWRSALLMALAIPLTLAMTFGFMWMLGIDLQQVSVASLIIALGLLVDDPVVAGDAIKHALGTGHSRSVAAWLGPTRLATAILYATITNIVAYLPFLLLSGDTGRYLYSLPVVITASLVASRIVSMTFIPLLGYYLLRPHPEPPVSELRQHGVYGLYYRLAGWAVDHRWIVLLLSLSFPLLGMFTFLSLRTEFFPKDLQYYSYVDLLLPNDQGLIATDVKTLQTEELIRQQAGDQLESLLTFEGGGSPRFWNTLDPQPNETYYAMVIIQLKDKWHTEKLIGPLAKLLGEKLQGVRPDVRQLETGTPVGLPVAFRIYGRDLTTMLSVGQQLKDQLAQVEGATRVRDDWGDSINDIDIEADPDRANLVGITNADIARSTTAALNGEEVGSMLEDTRQIPLVVKMRPEERLQLGDLKNLVIFSSQNEQRGVRLDTVASLKPKPEPETIKRRQFRRCLTVGCYPAAGLLPSQIIARFAPKLEQFKKSLPEGISVEMGGEQAEQDKSFAELVSVMAVSLGCIYLALVFQFKNAVKPLVVFAAVPYGITGAILALWVTSSPFGFMGFLGVASLLGVIVSHIIVLFDYIEEMHEQGESMRQSLLDAGIARLRPVFITVAATVIALVPLAASGGPLWQPLCYCQIGGLCVATGVTLVLVPVLYSIFVLDLKIIHWNSPQEEAAELAAPSPVVKPEVPVPGAGPSDGPSIPE